MMHHEYSWPWALMMHHEYSWCLMITRDAPWVLMMQHEYPWCIMSTHDGSWVPMMQHEYSWCIIGTSWVLMLYHCCIMWKPMMHHECSWCIRFVTKWNAMEVERISTKPISMMFRCASLPISRFSGSHFFVGVSIDFYVILKWSRSTHGSFRDHRWSIWRQSGTPVTILCWSDFSRNPKSWKSTVECFLWRFSTKLWAIDAESTPGYLQPSIYIENSRYIAQAAVMLFKLDKARNHTKDTHAKPSKWPAPHHRRSGFCHRSGVWQRDNYQNPTHGKIEAREFK